MNINNSEKKFLPDMTNWETVNEKLRRRLRIATNNVDEKSHIDVQRFLHSYFAVAYRNPLFP